MIINELDKAFGHKRAELIEVNDGAFYYEKNEQTRFLTLRQLAEKQMHPYSHSRSLATGQHSGPPHILATRYPPLTRIL